VKVFCMIVHTAQKGESHLLRVARTTPMKEHPETRAPGFTDLTPRTASFEGRRLVQGREAGGARPESGAQTIPEVNDSTAGSTGLLTAGRAGIRLAAAKVSRKTSGTVRTGECCKEPPAPVKIRDDLLSSSTISCWCKSSVMEMTKNRMTRVQPIAIVFRQWPGG
jgi:hypothetical protein